MTHGWGRDGVGEGHSQAKLTDYEVRQIRDLYATGHWSQRELAAMYKVSQPQICAILTRKARVA